MKKVFWAVAAMAMLATACTKDDAVSGGNESLVSFTIDSPELQTRYGEGEEATVLHYAFYNEDGILKAISATGDTETGDLQPVTLENKKATIQVPLVEGRTYSAIFWTSAPEAADVYTVDFGAKTVEMATTNLTANNEDYDAFYNYTIGIDPAEKTHKIELRRPFAQINIATADKAAASSAGFDAAATKVTVNAYNKLQFAVKEIEGVNTPVAEVAGDMVSFTYGWAANATGTATVGSKTYDMLSMNYVLVDARTLVNVKMEVSEDATNFTAPITRDYTTVPVQRNYRTYIVGNLLTTTNEFNVTTVPGFNPNDEIYEIWDGESTTAVTPDANGVYQINTVKEFAWLGSFLAGKGLKDANISINNSFDMGGHEFGNLMLSGTSTIEGNGNTIMNVAFVEAPTTRSGHNGGAAGAAFVYVPSGAKVSISNLTFDNASAQGILHSHGSGGAAIVSTYVQGELTLNKVNVKNSKVNGVYALGALVGDIATGTLTATNCSVEGVVIENTEVEGESGLLGSVVGRVAGKATIDGISVKDVDINAYVGEATSKRSVGGLVGNIRGGELALANVTKFEDVVITPKNAIAADYIDMIDEYVGGYYSGYNYTLDGENVYYKTASQKAFEAALAEGGEVKLTEDVELVVPIDIAEGADVTIDLNGKNFINTTSNGYTFYNENGGTLRITDTQNGGAVQGVVYTGANSTTIVDGGTFNATEGGKYVFLNSEGELTINGATINGGSNYPIYSYDPNSKLVINDATVNATFGCINSYGLGATVEINGGTFNMTGVQGNTSHIAYFSNVDVTINGGNFNKTGNISMSGTGGGGICVIYGANLTIEGGNFAGDYADIYDWGGTNANGRKNAISIKGGNFKFNPTAAWIAEGYKAEKIDGKYVVVADEVKVATSQEALNGAIEDGATIALAAGTYNMPSTGGNDITIVGSKDVVIKAGTSNMGSGNVTLEGVTITAGSYQGFQHSGVVTYNDVTIQGQLNCYGTKDIFNNCTFELNNAYVWTYGSDYTEFNNCTFNTTGKAILIYNEGAGACNVKVEGCTFNATAGAKAGAIANQNCAAIEIDNYAKMPHVLTTSGNTYSENFSGEWRIKSYVAGAPVTVNGVEYTQLAVDGKLMTIDANKNVTVVE